MSIPQPIIYIPLVNDCKEAMNKIYCVEQNGPLEYINEGQFHGVQLQTDKQQCISISTKLQIGGCVTISFVVKSLDDQQDAARILSISDEISDQKLSIRYCKEGNFYEVFIKEHNNNLKYLDKFNFDLKPGQWYNVLLVLNNNNSDLYLNWKKAKTQSISGLMYCKNQNSDVVIGSSFNRKENFFNGCVGDLCVFGCVLTEGEIQALSRFQPPKEIQQPELGIANLQKQVAKLQTENEELRKRLQNQPQQAPQLDIQLILAEQQKSFEQTTRLQTEEFKHNMQEFNGEQSMRIEQLVQGNEELKKDNLQLRRNGETLAGQVTQANLLMRSLLQSMKGRQ